MTYVISDLHGYPIEKFKMLLDKANFSNDDFLYILGDVIDRNGDGGVGILEWLLSQSNAQLILGNHEAMLLACAFLFDEITDESIENFDSKKIELLTNYQLNGGDVTLKSLAKLNKESPETVADILDIFTLVRFMKLLRRAKKIISFAIAESMNLIRAKKSATTLSTHSFGHGQRLTTSILTILLPFSVILRQ
jgi:predicted MPP superfamily phosphohydrolase